MVFDFTKFVTDLWSSTGWDFWTLYLPLANRTGEEDIHVGNGDCAAWAAKAILVDVCGLEQQKSYEGLEVSVHKVSNLSHWQWRIDAEHLDLTSENYTFKALITAEQVKDNDAMQVARSRATRMTTRLAALRKTGEYKTKRQTKRAQRLFPTAMALTGDPKMQGIGRVSQSAARQCQTTRGTPRRGERVGLTADWLGCTRYNGRVLQGLLESCSEREAGIARGVKWQLRGRILGRTVCVQYWMYVGGLRHSGSEAVGWCRISES